MSAIAPGRARLGQSTSGSVSLFPFLAVLLCTMGALIVLLVMIAHRARQQAAQAAAEQTEQQQTDLQTAHEDVAWRIEQIRQSRAQTETQLADVRLELGHLEDHARRLQERFEQLRSSQSQLHERTATDGREQRELEAELVRARAKLELAREALDAARQAAEQRGPAYAVVPYAGPNQTRQRPMYVECRDDAVVLQPEGVVLEAEDFSGPMGPGNPLAAALRAMREHLTARRGFDPQTAGEPYPLILVRPDGIAAYYAVREAMESWGTEFGYELIGEDWRLRFPPPDPQLASVVREALETARVRQAALAAAAPRHYDRPRPRYRVTPTRGGIVRESSPPEEPRGDYRAASSSGSFARRFGFDESEKPCGDASDLLGNRPDGKRNAIEGAAGDPDQRQPGDNPQQQDSRATPSGVEVSVQSFAEKRGEDWGLPGGARGSIPIGRDIRIECHADRLVLVPERGLGGRKEIPLDGPTVDAVDAFVSAVWKYMDSWGIAGHGMYWRPTLRVHVAPDAEPRFRELRTLLDGSGLEVEKG